MIVISQRRVNVHEAVFQYVCLFTVFWFTKVFLVTLPPLGKCLGLWCRQKYSETFLMLDNIIYCKVYVVMFCSQSSFLRPKNSLFAKIGLSKISSAKINALKLL